MECVFVIFGVMGVIVSICWLLRNGLMILLERSVMNGFTGIQPRHKGDHCFGATGRTTLMGGFITSYFSVDLLMMVLFIVIGCILWGCSTTHAEATVRSPYAGYQRVGIVSNLTRRQEEYFIPKYMQAFPTQTLVERRDLNTVIDEHDQSPADLTKEKRAALADFGVEAIIYPHFTEDADMPVQFSVKVIDTKTGEIVAAVLITPREVWLRDDATKRDMMKKAIRSLEKQKDAIISEVLRSGG